MGEFAFDNTRENLGNGHFFDSCKLVGLSFFPWPLPSAFLFLGLSPRPFLHLLPHSLSLGLLNWSWLIGLDWCASDIGDKKRKFVLVGWAGLGDLLDQIL